MNVNLTKLKNANFIYIYSPVIFSYRPVHCIIHHLDDQGE